MNQSFLNLPFEQDWRVNTPKCFESMSEEGQGKCQAGYAFSVAEAIRLRMCIRDYDNVEELSVQQLISCDYMNQQCEGGNHLNTWKYIENKGIVTQSCFRYQSDKEEVRTCEIDENCKRTHIKNIQILDKVGPLMQDVLINGPVTAIMDMYEDFLDYQSGIYQYKKGNFITKHSVVIVGYSRTNDEYWIAKNSFGSAWGEKGFFRIPFGHLSIDTFAVSAEPNL